MTATTTYPATDKQVAFIAKLADEHLAKKADGTYGTATVAEVVAGQYGSVNAWLTAKVRPAGKKAASAMIDKLMAAPKKLAPKKASRPAGGVRQSHQALHDTGECFCEDPTGSVARINAAAMVAAAAVETGIPGEDGTPPLADGPLPDVPAGHYAVPSPRLDQDLDFYRVDRPTEGKWAGRTFVKRVVGGHPDVNIRGAEQRDALARILAAGVMDARKTYGRELGACARCNRHLTDELSRRRGIGPDCWTREGWNYDDSDILAALMAEGGTVVSAEEA